MTSFGSIAQRCVMEQRATMTSVRFDVLSCDYCQDHLNMAGLLQEMERICAEALRDYQRAFFGLDRHDIAPALLQPGMSTPHSFFDTSPLFSMLDQPKPQYSYIGLIAMAILSSPEKKMVLSEVYEWIMIHYPYFRTRGSGWRNSIRHNLSLNDCFVKAGRAANGKGHYWAVHPACLRDFERGDFRRRRAQRKVRRHMGLSVPDGESSDDSPTPTPAFPFSLQEIKLQSAPPRRRDFSIDSLLAEDL